MRQLYDTPQSFQFTLEAYGYLAVVTVLTFSSLMYLVARQGAFHRFDKHVRVPRAILDKHFSSQQPSITVLVPSYSEDPQVIRKTLLSAALQEYPDTNIVLLIDDDVKKMGAKDRIQLDATHDLVGEIKKLLSVPYKRFATAYAKIQKLKIATKTQSIAIAKELSSQYIWASKWLNELADKELIEDHVDDFFANQVLRDLAKDLSLVAEALAVSCKEGVQLSQSRITQLYRRLTWIFEAKISYFERKQYSSLPHDASKAMNLNAYLGLMGGAYRLEDAPNGPVLLPTTTSDKHKIVFPDSEFVLTLDADSILLKDYCLRLVYFLQQPDNARVAVTQTPYSSFRGASTRIERLSGATTDIQHILHQGMSYYGATFWVGANAVIRKAALEDIVETDWVGGFQVKRYIQDSTVIEDTDSSIDLATHGWKLVNYPERLSYSATPPDFGSLVIQRRRWANGGLLIIPKLFNQIKERKNKLENVSLVEVMLRLNYIASIAWANLGLVFLLIYPYDGRLLSPFVLLAALPYFLAMASDLKYCNYKYSDVISIYGFNLILLPVNLAGVFKSLEQGLTSKKIPFARTPKVKDRTVAGLPYVIAPIIIVAFSIFTLWRNIQTGSWGNAALAGFNAVASLWAIFSYIGLGNLIIDIWLGLTNVLYIEVKDKVTNKPSPSKSSLNWRSILYHGEENGFMTPATAKEFIIDIKKEK